jgi:hypothetical protein
MYIILIPKPDNSNKSDFVLWTFLKILDYLLVCRKDLERLKAESKRNEDKVVKTELGKRTRS